MLQVQRSHKTEDTTDVTCDNIQREAHTVPGSEEVFKVPPSFPFTPLFLERGKSQIFEFVKFLQV